MNLKRANRNAVDSKKVSSSGKIKLMRMEMKWNATNL
jgi:hypothetical protein